MNIHLLSIMQWKEQNHGRSKSPHGYTETTPVLSTWK